MNNPPLLPKQPEMARPKRVVAKTPLHEPSLRSDVSSDSLGRGRLTSQRSTALLPSSRNSNPDHLNPGGNAQFRLSAYSTNSIS